MGYNEELFYEVYIKRRHKMSEPEANTEQEPEIKVKLTLCHQIKNILDFAAATCPSAMFDVCRKARTEFYEVLDQQLDF